MHTSRWPLAFLSALIAAVFLFIVFLLPCDGAQAHAQAPPLHETGAFSVPASRVQQPVRNAHASLALLAGSDSYVDAWVAYDIEFGSYNQGQCGTMQPHPDRIVGGNSNTWAILGCSTYGSWLVVDMGPDAEAIIDGPGNDFYVKEHNNNELYKVYVSNSPFGPWTPFGARKGNEYFNLADIGVSSARFLMLVAADCWYACPGADIQYIQALHMGDPLTGTLAGDETRAPECPVGNTSDASPGGGQPINLHSGNYHYQLPSFAVTSVGTPLLWDVSYNSHATDEYSYTLGYGWTHSYAMELVFPGDPGGEAGTVILRAAHGSRMRFFDNGDGTYDAAPRVWGTLTRTLTAPYTYSLTACNQATYVFDADGRLATIYDSRGNQTILAYQGSNLVRITDDASGHYLALSYESGRLAELSDPLSRTIGYGYDGSGNLAVVTDTRDLVWTLSYTGSHLLSEVRDPSDRVVEHTEFDGDGRAFRQFDGVSSTIEIEYRVDGTRVVTDAGRVTVYTYDSHNLLVGKSDAEGNDWAYSYDPNFHRVSTVPPQGRATYYSPNAVGRPGAVINPLGDVVEVEYDACDQPTAMTDTLGFVTRIEYEDHRPITITDALTGTVVNTYDESGLLVQTVDHGITTTYGYDSAGNRVAMTDTLQNVTTYEYDDAGRLITTTNPAGQVTVNTYDAADKLVRLTRNYTSTTAEQNYLDSHNLVTEYAYDGAGNLTVMTDTLGHVTRHWHDDANRLIRTTTNYSPTIDPGHGPGNQWNLTTRYGYDGAGNRVAVTDTLGYVTRNEYDGLGRIISTTVNFSPTVGPNYQNQWNLTTRYEYDAVGNQTQITDALGGVTRSWYDDLNRVVSTAASYSPTIFPGHGPGNDWNLTTRYGYDKMGRQVWVTDTLGHATYTEYNALGRPVTTTVNYVDGVLDPAYPDEDLVSVTTYDDAGRVSQRQDAGGRITAYEYDDLGRQTAVIRNYVNGVYDSSEPDRDIRSETVYNAFGQVAARAVVADECITTAYTYDAVGRLITTKNALSGTSVTHYDALGRQVETIDAEGHVTRYEYDAAGRLACTTANYSPTVGLNYDDQWNIKTCHTHDALGRRVATTNALGHTAVYTYDVAGRLSAQADPGDQGSHGNVTTYGYDGLGRRTVITDADGVAVYSAYDSAGRLAATTDALGNSTRYGYDALGRHTVVTNALGIATCYEHDGVGRQVAVVENCVPGESADYQTNVRTEYGYDQLGSLRVVTDALNHTTVYTYDLAGRRIAVEDGLGHVTRYVYDGHGRRVGEVYPDAGGPITVTTNYNALGWPTKVEYPAVGDVPAFTVEVSYDALGHRDVVTDSTGAMTYDYDPLYRPLGIDAPTGDAEYTYNALGQRVNLIYPTGETVTYTHDAAGRLQTVTDWEGGVTIYTYTAAGRLSAIGLPNSVETHYAYDPAGRLTEIEHSKDGELLGGYEYALNEVGNRVAVTETLVLPEGETAAAFDSGTAAMAAMIPVSSDTPSSARVADPTLPLMVPLLALFTLGRKNKRRRWAWPVVATLLLVTVAGMSTMFAAASPAMARGNGDTRVSSSAIGDVLVEGVDPWQPESVSSPASSAELMPALADYTIEVFADQPWQDFGITLEVGQQFQVEYISGEWTYWAGHIPPFDAGGDDYICGASYCCEPLPYDRKGALIGKIDSDVFFIGNGGSFTAGASGTLLFQTNDCDGGWGDNTGSVVVSVMVSEPPSAAFDADPAEGYAPLTVTFTNTSSGDIDNYLWEYGDGITSTTSAAVHTHIYAAAGAYTASLTVEDAVGHVDTASTVVTADEMPTGPGDVVVSVADTDGDPEPSLQVYVFDGTTYTGYNETTNASGVVTFTLSQNDYRFRADKNGTQFWSGEANHCAVPVCTGAEITTTVPVVISVEDTGGVPEAGLKVYAFDGTTYTGYNRTTDASGEATFTLPQGDYRFRADKNGTQFWSGEGNHCTLPGCTTAAVTTTIPVVVTVADTDSTPEQGLKVYVFDETTYTGYNGTTNVSGEVTFTLPQGDYRFRADKNGTQFWSGETNHCTLPSCTTAAVTTTVPVVVTVADTDGSLEEGLKVYAFDGTTYTGYNKTTDGGGQAVFTLPQGDYRFRADKNGTQFWSGNPAEPGNHCMLPGCTTAAVTTTIPVVVTVEDSDGSPEAGLKVYACDGTTYTGYNKTTDTSGLATFTLPQGDYRFRADKSNTQYWSGVDNHCTVPGCTATTVVIASPDVTVMVRDTDGVPEQALKVYVFDGTTYTGYNGTTNISGTVTFTLPEGDYRFRADKNGTQFWSGEANHCAVPGCAGAVVTATIPVVVTVADTDSTPEQGLRVYAFDGTTYTGYNKTTDAAGYVTFTLPLGDYRFRADKNGTHFWSGETNHCTLPGCTTVAVTTTIPVVVTVANTFGSPEAGLKVYAFDGTTYTGYNKTTDGSGQATFTLPEGNYRFRADKDGTQYWSDETNHCTLPGCTEATITLPGPSIITRTIVYVYDPLGRLTDADYSTGESYEYAYDPVGNRTTMTTTHESRVTHYEYDAANRLTAIDGTAYTWDARGNLTNDGTFTYTYNAAGRLVRAESVTSTLAYTYTAGGLRVGQSVDGEASTYAWDWASGLPEMLQSHDPQSANPQSLYLVGHETRGVWDGSEWAYYLPDALGSVRQVTDETGAVTAAREWTPYGVEVGGVQAGLGYTGEWQDPDLGLTYLRARWYDGYLNQFVSPDPVVPDYRNPQSVNLYTYALGNPIRYTDHSGLSPTVDCSIWPNYLGFLPLRDLCEVANDPNDGPDALDAREEIFRIIVNQGRNFSLIGGHGYRQAADMLEHFLDGGGAKLYITAPWDFMYDPGISRATHGLVGRHGAVTPDSFCNAQLPSDEPDWIMPLLWVFVQEHVQPHARQGESTVMPVSLIGTDYYSDDLPRPYDSGYWAAFGHVGLEHTGGIVGMLSGEVSPDCSSDGYFLEYLAHYHVEDRYQWFEGKQTPMSFPGTSGVYIPHEWEISLAEAFPPRAAEYDFDVDWTVRGWLYIPSDFTWYRPVL